MPALMRRRESGGIIDRSRPLTFSFNGKPCLGYAGDTLASALLANGIDLIGRSIRYGRPRGITGAGLTDQSAYLRLHEDGAERTVLATQIDLYEGLMAESLLDWPPPSLLDRVRGRHGKRHTEVPCNESLRAAFSVDAAFGHCDVLIVGAGPAGLSAALAAGQAGARVMVIDDQPVPGGSLSWCRGSIGDTDSRSWLNHTEASLRGMSDVRILCRSTAVGFDEDGRVMVVHARPDKPGGDGPASGKRFQLWKLGASQVVLASGALERALVFPDNDLPGVMLSSAMLHYARRYALAPARGPVAVFTNNDRGHTAACMMHDEGIKVAAVIDVRREIEASSIGALCDRGLTLIGGTVIRAITGDTQVEGVELALTAGDRGAAPGPLPCRAVALCGGFNPRLDLIHRAGGKARYDETRGTLVPDGQGSFDHVVGSVTGNVSLRYAVESGRAAGLAAARAAGLEAEAPAVVPADEGDSHILPFWRVSQGVSNRAKQWVDLRRDLTTSDLSPAVMEGQTPILGPLEDLQLQVPPLPDFSRLIERAGAPPPPARRMLPAHAWHADQGAAFRVSGGWLTPGYYPDETGDREAAITAEMKAARNGVAAMDLSALSKVEIRGPDSLTLLDMLCCENLGRFPVDTIRYVRLLDDGGRILEHGVVSRPANDRFVLTTSPMSEDAVVEWINTQLRTRLQKLRTCVVPVSAQWATFSLTGPRARQVLLDLKRDIDVSTSAFPFLALRRGLLCGARAHLARTSYAGEVAFEIAVSANYGRPMWEMLCAAGTKYNMAPMGQDALARLGAEKGRIDAPRLAPKGLTPFDVDLAGTYSPKHADFIGKEALLGQSSGGQDRLQLVALRADDGTGPLPEDGILVQDGAPGGTREGRVAISFNSPALSQPLTLALVLRGKQRIGETVYVTSGGRTITARIVRPTIFDPGGRRRHG